MAYTTIDDPSAYFQTALYTGDGQGSGINVVTNDGNSDLQPDWVWTKERSGSSTNQNHTSIDSSRGITKQLFQNSTSSEGTSSAFITSLNSDGFALGDNANINYNTATYVAWQWKANGGTTSSNTDGDITTTVQANTTAGFSIATYTGNGGSGQTLGHGLGAEPDIVIFKDRDSTSAWRVYTKMTGASKFLNLNTNDAAQTSPNIFPSVSSTTIGVEQNDVMNKSGSNHVMYSFRSIQGYSKIGSFTGNGSTDGPFVYTGFKPAWLMYKEDESAGGWGIWDNKRVAYNPINIRLLANTNAADDTSNDNRQDFLSNGFKVRTSSGGFNESGRTIYYMAFAEHPFVSSKGVPTTAR